MAVNECFGKLASDVESTIKEVSEECNCFSLYKKDFLTNFSFKNFVHVPFLPPLQQPGWLLEYLLGPFDHHWLENIYSDFQAGITVLLTLVPQGLSQATLANMPPIYGLYTALVPGAVYCIFGTSMQVTCGPTAVVSLLTGNFMTKYGVDWEEDLELAVDTAAQAAFCCGIILIILGFFNLGSLINFMSHPVMSGFTTGAALVIGLTQLKSAVGFSISPPQSGGDVDYNYQVMKWWHENWNYKDSNGHQGRNHYAVAITFGLYVPLMVVQLFKWNYKPSNETKKTWVYRIWNLLTLLLPLIAIIIGARIAYEIKKEDHFMSKHYVHSYYAKGLKVVGVVPGGINVGRIPRFRWPMSQFFADILPLTLISFMESWSIARGIASQKNQLHFLSASQEMWSVGLANLCGCVASSYPATASFSRSALNASAGARTPLASSIVVLGLMIVLTQFTKGLHFIPQAALSAIIYVAIANLICFSDFWRAWKHSKKDFFTMFVTTTFTFVYDTSIGLAIGLGCSVAMYCIFDIILAKSHSPRLFTTRRTDDGKDVDVLRIESDLNFLTAASIKDFIVALVVKAPVQPPATNKSLYLRYEISSRLDRILKPNIRRGVDELPKAIVIDLCLVKTVDLSGLESLESALHEVRLKGVKVAIININPEISGYLTKFGITSDESTEEINFERYEKQYFMDLWSFQDGTNYLKHSNHGNKLENEENNYNTHETFHEIELQTIRDETDGNSLHSLRNRTDTHNEVIYGNISQVESL